MPLRLAALITLSLLLAACSTAPASDRGGASENTSGGFGYAWQRYDDQSKYRIEPVGDGFTVHVYLPLTRRGDARIDRYLRRTALDIAEQHADDRDRALVPLKPSDVHIDAIRNPFTAVMHWHATVDAMLQ